MYRGIVPSKSIAEKSDLLRKLVFANNIGNEACFLSA